MKLVLYWVTTCLENLEMSGNLKRQGNVRDVVNSQGIVRKCQEKNLVVEKYTNMHSFYANTLNNNTIYLTLTPKDLATVYLNISISFKNSA